jgi:hypothetical protein
MIQKERKKPLISNDRVAEKLQHLMDSTALLQKGQMDSATITKNFNSNIDQLL